MSPSVVLCGKELGTWQRIPKPNLVNIVSIDVTVNVIQIWLPRYFFTSDLNF